jgi:N-acetylglutamate synthase-like GNAT family acetyltransferase
MNPNYQVRRATLDDIGPLTELWKTMHFPADDLGKRITEFQIAEEPGGRLLGGVGLQIADRQGRIHSEGFVDFSVADALRPLLLERVRAVATNHGLYRLWTQEQAPFWHRSGLTNPDAEALEKLPAAWRQPSARWLTSKLKDDVETLVSVDKEFAVFMQSEKEKTAKALQRAKALKALATLVLVCLCLLMVAALFFMLRKNPRLLGR